MIAPQTISAGVSSGYYQPHVYTAAQSAVHVRWRCRESHPWTMEPYDIRDEAYRRYFYLLDRGVEVELRPPMRQAS